MALFLPLAGNGICDLLIPVPEHLRQGSIGHAFKLVEGNNVTVKSGKRALICALFVAGLSCSISPARAWSDEIDTSQQQFPESAGGPPLDKTRSTSQPKAESNFQALYNWRMTEKKSFSMGVMVLQDPVYLNNNSPNGIAIFRYRVKF